MRTTSAGGGSQSRGVGHDVGDVGVLVGRGDQVGPGTHGEDAHVGAAVGLGEERDRRGVPLLQPVVEAKLKWTY